MFNAAPSFEVGSAIQSIVCGPTCQLADATCTTVFKVCWGKDYSDKLQLRLAQVDMLDQSVRFLYAAKSVAVNHEVHE
jgi:hypothetical protein